LIVCGVSLIVSVAADRPTGLGVMVDETKDCIQGRQAVATQLRRISIEVDAVDRCLPSLRQFFFERGGILLVTM